MFFFSVHYKCAILLGPLLRRAVTLRLCPCSAPIHGRLPVFMRLRPASTSPNLHFPTYPSSYVYHTSRITSSDDRIPPTSTDNGNATLLSPADGHSATATTNYCNAPTTATNKCITTSSSTYDYHTTPASPYVCCPTASPAAPD